VVREDGGPGERSGGFPGAECKHLPRLRIFDQPEAAIEGLWTPPSTAQLCTAETTTYVPARMRSVYATMLAVM
jgi:hypothetical protein